MFTHSKVRLSCDFKSKHKTWVSKSNTTMAKWARQFNREITVWDQHPQFQMDAGTQQQNQQRKIEKNGWMKQLRNVPVAMCISLLKLCPHFIANQIYWIQIVVYEFAYQPVSQPKLSTEWTIFKRRNQISSTKKLAWPRQPCILVVPNISAVFATNEIHASVRMDGISRIKAHKSVW